MSALVVFSFLIGPIVTMTLLAEGEKYLPNGGDLSAIDPYALKILLCAVLLVTPLFMMIVFSTLAWYMVASYGTTQGVKTSAYDFLFDMSVVISCCITIFMMCMFMYALRDSSFVYACLLANLYGITVIQRNMSASRVTFAPFLYAVFSAGVMYAMTVGDPRIDPYFVYIGDEILNVRFKARVFGTERIHENPRAISNEEQYLLHLSKFSSTTSMYADSGPFNDRVNGVSIIAPSVFNEPIIAVVVLSLSIFCLYSFFALQYRAVYMDNPSLGEVFSPAYRGEENLHRFISSPSIKHHTGNRTNVHALGKSGG
jgi:hypothetical protein